MSIVRAVTSQGLGGRILLPLKNIWAADGRRSTGMSANLAFGGLVTVFGGSGFVGRYAVQRLARRGWRI